VQRVTGGCSEFLTMISGGGFHATLTGGVMSSGTHCSATNVELTRQAGQSLSNAARCESCATSAALVASRRATTARRTRERFLWLRRRIYAESSLRFHPNHQTRTNHNISCDQKSVLSSIRQLGLRRIQGSQPFRAVADSAHSSTFGRPDAEDVDGLLRNAGGVSQHATRLWIGLLLSLSPARRPASRSCHQPALGNRQSRHPDFTEALHPTGEAAGARTGSGQKSP